MNTYADHVRTNIVKLMLIDGERQDNFRRQAKVEI